MNGLKVRKLAAIIAGGALLGAAAAPMVSAMTSAEASNAIYDANNSPVVNVVVGSTAALSDAVWAGNIARSVVEHAVMTKTFDGTGTGGNGQVSVTDLEAVLSLGGTVTVTGGKTFDSANLNSASNQIEYAQEISEDPLSFLVDESVSYKHNASSTTISVKETVGVSLDAKFDTDDDVRDLVAVVDAADINYSLNLGAGIPTNESTNSTTDFTDGSNDNIRIPFFGKTYLVQSMTVTDANVVTEVRLVEDKAKQTFVSGESFTMQGIGAYDGQTLTVTVSGITAPSGAGAFQAKFSITDEAGNLIDVQTVDASNFVTFEDQDGDDVASGDIFVEAVGVNTGTNEGTVDVLVGTSSVRLLAGENYPYTEAADEENIDGPYTVALNGIASTNRLTSIVISNQEKDDDEDSPAGEVIAAMGVSVFDEANPLYASHGTLTDAGDDGQNEFNFLDGTGALGEDFFTITFNGFETDEEMTYLKVGNNEMTFRDASDSSHTIPLWWKEESVTGSAVKGNSEGKKFTFDESQELWYDLNTSSQDFNVVNGTVVNGVAIIIASATLQTDLGAVSMTTLADTAVVIRGVTYIADSNSTTAVNLTADGYVRVADSELDSDVSAADLVNGLASGTDVAAGTGGTCTATSCDDVFFYDDGNVSGNAISVSTAPMLLPLSGDNYFTPYSYFVSESGGSGGLDDGVYFMLYGDPGTAQHTTSNGQAVINGSVMQNSKQFSFLGTDVAEDGTVDRNFYFPQISDLAQDESSSTHYAATFQVDENNDSVFPARFYIDTQTDDIPDTDDEDIVAPTSDVNYGWSTSSPGANGITFSLDQDDADSLMAAYTDFGTKISIESGDSVEFWIPENRPQVEFVVTGQSSTSTVEGGEEITVALGETGMFTTGTEVTVKDITYTATIIGGGTSEVVTNGAPFTYTTPSPLNGKAMVYTTASVPMGPKIIVGGPIVNELAQEVADMLNAPGDMVAGVYGSNIIVAGYTAEDTGQAAQDLIDALDAI